MCHQKKMIDSWHFLLLNKYLWFFMNELFLEWLILIVKREWENILADMSYENTTNIILCMFSCSLEVVFRMIIVHKQCNKIKLTKRAITSYSSFFLCQTMPFVHNVHRKNEDPQTRYHIFMKWRIGELLKKELHFINRYNFSLSMERECVCYFFSSICWMFD